MWSWINKIFRNNISSELKSSGREIDFIQISKDWNADPVSPEIELNIEGCDLIMDINLNHFMFDNYKEGDKAKIRFENCSEYSLNICNDEGYYAGQYRTNANELPWGEFYEIIQGLDRGFPEPVVKLKNDGYSKRHFIFFFKDETFECLANDFLVKFDVENSKELN